MTQPEEPIGAGRGPYAPAVRAIIDRIEEMRREGLAHRTWYRHLLLAWWLVRYAPIPLKPCIHACDGCTPADIPADMIEELTALERISGDR